MNIITAALFQEFSTIVPILATDKQVRVVVFKSKVPGFFCPHFDLGWLFRRGGREAVKGGTERGRLTLCLSIFLLQRSCLK